MDNIPQDPSFEDIVAMGAQTRRETRRSLEKEAASKSSDKLRLNDIMLFSLVLVAAAISFTDFTISLGSLRNFTALTLFLYIITTLVYRNRYDRGIRRGKTDPEYIEALTEYREKKQRIYDEGLASLVPEFCRDYKVSELRKYRESLLADIDMDYSEYKEKYQRLTPSQIRRLKLPREMKKVLIKCNKATPLKLVPGLILTENGEMDREKLLGTSGRQREIADKRQQLISRGLMVLFGSAIAINIILDFSLITVIQWLVRMVPIISAIIMGDDGGYCNIAVTETNFKQDQVSVINLFFEYVAERKTAGEQKEKTDT